MDGRSRSIVITFAMVMLAGLVTEGGEGGRGMAGRRAAKRRVRRGSGSARTQDSQRVGRAGGPASITLPHHDGMLRRYAAPPHTHRVPDASRRRLLLPAVNAARAATGRGRTDPKSGATDYGRGCGSDTVGVARPFRRASAPSQEIATKSKTAVGSRRRSPDLGHRRSGTPDVNGLELDNGGLDMTDEVPMFGDADEFTEYGSDSDESDEGS